MLVCINTAFKVPVPHYLVNFLNDEGKSPLIKDLLNRLHKNNIHEQSLTFYGASDSFN